MTKLHAVAFLAVLASLVPGCSYETAYEYDVFVAPEVAVPSGATVHMVAVESPEDRFDASFIDDEMVVVPEARMVAGEGVACCLRSEVRSFYAFVDLNGDGDWDEDEPWGEDPDNPVTLKQDGYVATIVIE